MNYLKVQRHANLYILLLHPSKKTGDKPSFNDLIGEYKLTPHIVNPCEALFPINLLNNYKDLSPI